MANASIFAKASVYDFFIQPSRPSNPPINQCRMFYLGDDTFHVVDSTGSELLGGGAPAFNTITGGTNAAALIIGTGGSLTTSGSGTIAATSAPWSGLTSTLANGQVIPYADSGISRVSAGLLAVGNGSAGDFSGTMQLTKLSLGSNGQTISVGSGSPQGVVTAAIGSLYLNFTGTTSTSLWVKESTTGNTGWTAK